MLFNNFVNIFTKFFPNICFKDNQMWNSFNYSETLCIMLMKLDDNQAYYITTITF